MSDTHTFLAFLQQCGNYLLELNYVTAVIRLVLAACCGALMGLNREKKQQAAGLRTHTLVCTASCLAMMTGLYVAVNYDGDPGRLAAQVISGVGFLGAGTIMVGSHQSGIRGLTTAANLWAAAGVGLALGCGFYIPGLVACAVMLFILSRLERVDNRINPKLQHMELYVEIEDISVMRQLILVCKSRGYRIISLETNRGKQGKNKTSAVLLDVQEEKAELHQTLLESLEKIPGVIFVTDLSA